MSTFLGGFLFAFVRGWLLSLTLVSMILPLVIVGGVTAIIISKISIRQQTASSEARDVVEETLGAIRTVGYLIFCSFNIISNCLSSLEKRY